ncbi:hypothetical protein D3C76_1392470 [compost metagenome]
MNYFKAASRVTERQEQVSSVKVCHVYNAFVEIWAVLFKSNRCLTDMRWAETGTRTEADGVIHWHAIDNRFGVLIILRAANKYVS